MSARRFVGFSSDRLPDFRLVDLASGKVWAVNPALLERYYDAEGKPAVEFSDKWVPANLEEMLKILSAFSKKMSR